MQAIARNVRPLAILFPRMMKLGPQNRCAAPHIRDYMLQSVPFLCYGPRRRQEPLCASEPLSGFGGVRQRAGIVMQIVLVAEIAGATQMPLWMQLRAADANGCAHLAPGCADDGGVGDDVCAPGDDVCAPGVADESAASYSADAGDCHD